MVKKLGGKSQDEPMLLNHRAVKHAVIAREMVHFALVLGVISVVILALMNGVDKDADPWGPAWLDSGVKTVVTSLPYGEKLYEHFILRIFVDPNFLLLSFGLVLVYIASRFIRTALGKVFTGFWRDKLPGPWWE